MCCVLAAVVAVRCLVFVAVFVCCVLFVCLFLGVLNAFVARLSVVCCALCGARCVSRFSLLFDCYVLLFVGCCLLVVD